LRDFANLVVSDVVELQDDDVTLTAPESESGRDASNPPAIGRCGRRESNPHLARFELVASALLGYARVRRQRLELRSPG
jgi:hypothetical protein